MRLLVTGATGFIGWKLLGRLLEAGHELELVVRPGSQIEKFRPFGEQVHAHVYDGTQASLAVAVEQARPEAVIHLASLFIAQHKPEDVTQLVASNLLFPNQLLEVMSQAGVRYFINTGTSWQHYLNQQYDPVNLYAATKQAFDALLQFYVEAQGFKAITLMLFDTYGPGDSRPKLFKLLRSSVRDATPLKMSAGEQLLDLVYIDDVLNAYVCALERLPLVDKIECYGVASGERRTLRDIVAIYGEVVGRPVNVAWGALPYRKREVMEPWTDYRLLPGWRPAMNLRDGMAVMERDSSIGGLLASSKP